MHTESGGGYWVARELPPATEQQIDSLLSCWKRDRELAVAFIESAKKAVLTWLSLPKASEPVTEVRDRASELKQAAAHLERTLKAAEREQSFMLGIQAEIRERTATAMTGHIYDLLEGWQAISAHHNGTPAPGTPDGFDVREIITPLTGVLNLIADAAGGLADSIEPKPGPNTDHEKYLISQLVARYREVFGKMPGKSAESPLMQFWEGIRPIIGTVASHRVVLEHIRQLEKNSRQ